MYEIGKQFRNEGKQVFKSVLNELIYIGIHVCISVKLVS